MTVTFIVRDMTSFIGDNKEDIASFNKVICNNLMLMARMTPNTSCQTWLFCQMGYD